MARLSKDIEAEKQKQQEQWLKEIKVDNQLIEAFLKHNNASAMKLLFYVANAELELHRMNAQKLEKKEIYSVNIGIDKLCELTNTTKRTYLNNLSAMRKIEVSITDDKKDSYIVVFPHMVLDRNTNKLELKIFREILELVAEVEKKYTIVDIENLMRLKKAHSLRMIQLLEWISGFDTAKRKHYTLEELNRLFGVKYKTYTDFEKNILIPVKQELDSTSKLSFEYVLWKDKIDSNVGRPKIVECIIDVVEQKHVQGKLL